MKKRWNYKTLLKNLVKGIIYLAIAMLFPIAMMSILLAPPAMW